MDRIDISKRLEHYRQRADMTQRELREGRPVPWDRSESPKQRSLLYDRALEELADAKTVMRAELEAVLDAAGM